MFPKSSINRAKICLTCTSKHKYRWQKWLKSPACGSALASDIPNQDEESSQTGDLITIA
jgi:hypothetical protein